MYRSTFLPACVALAVGLLSLPHQSWAQSLEKVATPIDVRVAAPSAPGAAPGGGAGRTVVPTGAAVRIFGTSVQMGKTPDARQVRIDVKPPSGAAAKLTAEVKTDGTWATTFTGTTAPGEYGVTAFAPGGKNSASVSFTVASASTVTGVVDALVTGLSKGAADADAGLSAAQASLSAKGPYPNQATVAGNLTQTQAAVKELPARLKVARQALAKLGEIASTYPAGAGELEPMTTAMSAATQEADGAASSVRKATLDVGKSSGICDRIDAVNEVLNAGLLWFDIQGRIFAKLAQLAADKYLPDRIYNAAVPPAKRNSTEKFGLAENLKGIVSAMTGAAEGGKAGAGQGLVDFVKKPQNLLLDTAQLLTGLAFDKYCEKFTGPVSGTFRVDATVNGQKFWGYTTLINGTLTIRYEKKTPKAGEAIPITGEFEGNGAFSVYEDLMAFNTFNRQFVIYRQLFQPVGFSAGAQSVVEPLGKMARMITPGYFRVPITGSIAGDQLTLTVGDGAYNDFSDLVKGRAVYVVLAPAAPIPYTMASTIPIQKAQFIISRGLRTTVTLPIATTTAGKQMLKTISKTFDRKEVVSNGEVTVTWKIQLKACNPDCGG